MNYFEKEEKNGLYIEDSSYISAFIYLLIAFVFFYLSYILIKIYWYEYLAGFVCFIIGLIEISISQKEFRNAARMHRYMKMLISK